MCLSTGVLDTLGNASSSPAITPTGGITFRGSTSGTLTTVAAATTNTYSVTLPAAAPTTGQVLTATSATVLDWSTPVGTIKGTLAATANLMCLSTGVLDTLGNASSGPAITPTGGVSFPGSTSGAVTCATPATVATYNVTLPAAAPTAANQVLQTSSDYASTNTLTWISNISALNQQVFTANGTYTPTTGMRYCIIEVVGGGGGGGAGNSITTAPGCAAGGSGGAASYGRAMFTAATIGASKAVVVGAGGTGQLADLTAATAGGTSSVGSTLISCPGGDIGSGSAYTVTVSNGGRGANASAPSFSSALGGTVSVVGERGNVGAAWISVTTGFCSVPSGGSSYFRAGGLGGAFAATANPGNRFGSVTGNPGAYGSGGGASGVVSVDFNGVTGPAGGAGGGGLVVITEYA